MERNYDAVSGLFTFSMSKRNWMACIKEVQQHFEQFVMCCPTFWRREKNRCRKQAGGSAKKEGIYKNVFQALNHRLSRHNGSVFCKMLHVNTKGHRTHTPELCAIFRLGNPLAIHPAGISQKCILKTNNNVV